MGVFIDLAADPAAYQILEARLIYKVLLEDGLSRTCFNIQHYHKFAGTGGPSLLALADSFWANFGTNLIPLMNVRVTGGRADIRPLDDPLVPPVDNTAGPLGGSVTGDPLSLALAACAFQNTGVRGRSFSGSKHFGGLSEADTDGGDELKAAALTAWNAAYNLAMASISDSGTFVYTPCVLSTTLSNILGTPPTFTGADVQLFGMKKILGTMRKRKERVGT